MSTGIALLKGGIVIIVAIFGYTLGRDLAHKSMTGATVPPTGA
jgi:hypothetical protein